MEEGKLEEITQPRGGRAAFGGPGTEPRWTHSNKDGVGTAYSADSPLWFTLWRGILTEVYYPTIDRPQMRDLELLFSDGESFVHEEKRDLVPLVERIDPHALGYRVRSHSPGGEYSLDKEVISAPHLPCLLERVRLKLGPGGPTPTSLYVLCAPHLAGGGWGNNAEVYEGLGSPVLVAERSGVWLALGAAPGFARASVGYVGQSDGWTDLMSHRKLEWEFDTARDGNVALTGELRLPGAADLTIAVAFGQSLQAATSSLYQSLSVPFEEQKERFVRQWRRSLQTPHGRHPKIRERGHFFHGNYCLLLAHEDKVFPGAFIASPSIPWGAINSDRDLGGYHLVWTRDMVQIATALLAAGNSETALRALIYLATCQRPDGGFPQNSWLDGTPYWNAVQLDEIAFPILLAFRLHREHALRSFDPLPMVLAASRYLVRNGPVTEQDRWEEVGGYSPSTLAVVIAALVCAGTLAREHGDPSSAKFLEEYADFLESHLEAWTVTSSGTLLPGVPRHYVRIQPMRFGDPVGGEHLDGKIVTLPNLPPGSASTFPADEIVDGGFLDLVRYGIRDAQDPLVVDSLRVVDAVLRVETPFGPCWRRFNHDGYGQAEDGGPYTGTGQGRAWPLLTGERGHYELAAGRDARPYLTTMEHLATATGLLPEQVWDSDDIPAAHQFLGRPTESAVPLAWAHAEYAKLARSIDDRQVFDLIPEVAARYVRRIPTPSSIEIWTFQRQPQVLAAGRLLRIVGEAPFVLRWSDDGWATSVDTPSVRTPLGLEYVDLPPLPEVGRVLRFTFRWPASNRWEGRDFSVTVS
jgi:glucoamylase